MCRARHAGGHGKYSVQVSDGGYEKMLNTLDHLVAQERARAPGGARASIEPGS
jgi:hypothetical protein